MKKFQIKNIKTYFISPCEGKYKERCEKMKILGEKMDSLFILQKSGNVYPQSLNDAHSLILKSNFNDEPILLLEDDVKWNGTLEVEIPQDADALYLGNSNAGNYFFKWPNFQKTIDPRYHRVLSMRATHAIIYISKKYKEFASLSIDGSKQVLDVSLASIQKHFQVYTLTNPIFYQDNSNADNTNLTVHSILSSRNAQYTKIAVGSVLIFLLLIFIIIFYTKNKLLLRS